MLDETAAENGQFNDILGPWREFKDSIQEWHALAETSMLTAYAL